MSPAEVVDSQQHGTENRMLGIGITLEQRVMEEMDRTADEHDIPLQMLLNAYLESMLALGDAVMEGTKFTVVRDTGDGAVSYSIDEESFRPHLDKALSHEYERTTHLMVMVPGGIIGRVQDFASKIGSSPAEVVGHGIRTVHGLFMDMKTQGVLLVGDHDEEPEVYDASTFMAA